MLFFLLSLMLAQSPVPAVSAPAPPAVAVPAAVTAPQEPADPAAPRAANDPRTYLIGAQDSLKIFVFEEPALSNSYKVGADGSFDYPYIGRVAAVGKTLRELEEEITQKLADGYVRKPQVTVEVDQFRSRNIFVMGEVRNASKYPLTGQMTLLEALVAAGYVTTNAGTQVLVVRQPADRTNDKPAGPGEQGIETLKLNLADVQAGKPEANIFLREGDNIIVPKAEKFYVSGFVKSPGAFAHEAGMTVLQALSLAGGVNEKGSTRGIKIKRKGADGKEKDISVDMNDVIEPGDTIVVRQRLL